MADRFKPCVVILEDTYDGKLINYDTNYQQIKLSAPYTYISHIYDLLKKKNPHYTMTCIADRSDNRILNKAIIQFGKRVMTYTNVNAQTKRLAPRSDDQYLVYRVEQSHLTTWNLTTKAEPSQWAKEKHAIWCGNGDKGGYDPNKSKWTQKVLKDGTVLISGKYWHFNKWRTLEYESMVIKGKYCIVIRIKDTTVTSHTIETNMNVKQEDGTTKSIINAGKWIKSVKAEAEAKDYTGEVHINTDKHGHYRLYGKWTKSWEVGKGVNKQKHFITQIWTSDSIAREKQLDTSYTPNIKQTYTTFANEDEKSTKQVKMTSSRNYRTINQDQDIHTAEIKKDLRKKEHWDINREYEKYLRDMRLLDRVQNMQYTIEYLKKENKKRKLKPTENKAKLWLQKIDREKPEWINLSNATMLINYCAEQIIAGTMVGAEATKFCEKNAK